VRIVPDVELSRCFNDVFDLILVPGGPGAENLAKVFFLNTFIVAFQV